MQLCLVCLLAHLSSVTLLLPVAHFYHLRRSPRGDNVHLRIPGAVTLPQQPVVSALFVVVKAGVHKTDI